MYRQIDRQIDRYKDKQMGIQIDRQLDRQTDRQTDRQIYRQKDRLRVQSCRYLFKFLINSRSRSSTCTLFLRQGAQVTQIGQQFYIDIGQQFYIDIGQQFYIDRTIVLYRYRTIVLNRKNKRGRNQFYLDRTREVETSFSQIGQER